MSSIMSRVVPWISDTIALSSFRSAFRRDDFPAFVGPMIAVGIPFLIALPVRNEWWRFFIWLRSCVVRVLSCVRSANWTSWSEKSSSSSSRDARLISWVRSGRIVFAIPPLSCDAAIRAAALDCAAIMSAVASACGRSIFPDANARRVNSPGFASRAGVVCRIVWRISCWRNCEPWIASSTVSCPVNDAGVW